MTPIERHRIRKLHQLSVTDEIILDIVRQNHEERVMNIINNALNENVASQATIHTSLKNLSERGYVEVIKSRFDSRKKVCQLTLKGKRYLDKLI